MAVERGYFFITTLTSIAIPVSKRRGDFSYNVEFI